MEELLNSTNSLYTFIIFLIAIILSILINGLFLKFSSTMGTKNQTDEKIIRWASTSKPALGGISFFIIFLFAIAVFSLFNHSNSLINKKYLAILLSCTIGFLIGLADDAYNTKPILKFSGQLLCAIILLSAEIYISLTPFRILNYFITILWVIGIMNSINMLDNMDGVVTTISGVIILAIVVVMLIHGQSDIFYYITAFGVIAGLIGFLFYNWHPSKMYMGDTGSQFLGAYLSAISILFIWHDREADAPIFQIRQYILPMIIFLIPLIDTTTVSIRRVARGSSPFVGGRDHITHHLALMGVKDYWVCFIYLLLSAICSAIIIYLNYIHLATEFYNPIGIGMALGLFIIIQLMYQRNAHLHRSTK